MNLITLSENVRRFTGMQMSRLHFRKQQTELITFTRSISGARRGLLIMPVGRTEWLPVATIVNLLKKRFPERGLTVVTWGPSLELMQMLPHSNFVRVVETEITRFYLPSHGLLARIENAGYDVAIDLNLDLVLPSGYICRASNARVRIGFTSKGSDLFYNFQIKRNPSMARQGLYDRLAACLERF